MENEKTTFFIKDLNYAFPIFKKTAAGTEFVQINISYTMPKDAFDLLSDYGYDFYENAKEEARECYFELLDRSFDVTDDEVIE